MRRYIGLAVVWLVGFNLFFYSFTLPNSIPQTKRSDIWRVLPDLLLECALPTGHDPKSGWQFFPQRFDLLLVAAAIQCGAWGLGHLLLRLLRVPLPRRCLERTVFAFGLGLAGLSLFTLGCGLNGWLLRPVFIAAIALCFLTELACRLAERWLPPQSRTRAHAGRNKAVATGHSTFKVPPKPLVQSFRGQIPLSVLLRALALICMALFLLAMVLGAALPPTDFDVKEYHLVGPKEFYQAGRISMLPHNVYTSFPFLTEMLSLMAMVLRNDWYWGALAGKLVLMCFAPLTALAVFAAARRWFGTTAAWLAALIHLSTPWTYRISIIAYAEGGLTFYLFATLLAALHVIERFNADQPDAPTDVEEVADRSVLQIQESSSNEPLAERLQDEGTSAEPLPESDTPNAAFKDGAISTTTVELAEVPLETPPENSSPSDAVSSDITPETTNREDGIPGELQQPEVDDPVALHQESTTADASSFLADGSSASPQSDSEPPAVPSNGKTMVTESADNTALASEFAATIREHTGTTALTLVAGLLAGGAMSCKYPGVVSVVIPLGAAIVVAAFRRQDVKSPWSAAIRAALVFSLGTLLTIGPWLWKNTVETGNPVYPLLYTVFGGTDWTPELNERWRGGHSPDSHELQDLAVKLIDVTTKSDWLSPLLFGLAPLSLLLGRGRGRTTAGWLWCYVAYLFLSWWVLTHRIDRFWVPLIPVVALLAGAGMTWTDSRIWRIIGGTVMACAIVLNLGFITTKHVGFNAYLADINLARQSTESTAGGIELLNSLKLPPTTRVLCVGEAQVFDARFQVIYNTVFDESIFEIWCSAAQPGVPAGEQTMRSADEIHRTFADANVALVLVNWQELLRYRRTYGYTDFDAPPRLTWLVEHGILGRPIPQLTTFASYDDLSDDDKKEIDRWAPELKRQAGGETVYIAMQVFPVMIRQDR